uniref:Small ribosomal subunit protein uS14c n=1 Tax=Crouania attenuata TaxID=42002 RepID=A0A4D6WQ65_9FLOR|nr:ribosomal protein S14 [Crouania attenuata]
MAKQSMIQKEMKRYSLTTKYFNKRQEIKKLIHNKENFDATIEMQKKLQKLPRNSMPCRQRKRCWMTGRSRGVYRDFGLSRHVLREMSHECLLPGMRKASW